MKNFQKDVVGDIFVGRDKKRGIIEMPDLHYHDSYEIYYLLKGKVRYFIENTVIEVNPGDVVLIPPNVLHKTAGKVSNVERLLISFSGSFLNKDEDAFFYKCFKNYHYSETGLHDIFLTIESEYNKNGEYSGEIIKTAIEYALMKLSTEKSSREMYSADISDSIIIPAVNYINEHYEEKISLDALSEHYSVSKYYFSRKFKEVTGIGLSDYIMAVRIKNAELLLKSTKYSITEISGMCGFNDSSYFTAVFKKTKGMTPLKYRRLAK